MEEAAKAIEALDGAIYIPENIMVTGGAGSFASLARSSESNLKANFFSLVLLVVFVSNACTARF